MLEENCADIWNVLDCLLAPSDYCSLAPAPKGRWWEWLAKDFFSGIIQYAKCRRAGPALPPPFAPKCTLREWATPALQHFLSSLSFVSMRLVWCAPLSFNQSVCTTVCFVILPLLGFPTRCRVQPHLSLFKSWIYWNYHRSVHSCQWAVDFTVLWKTTELWGWTLWGSSYICFQIQNLNYDFPRSHPSFR